MASASNTTQTSIPTLSLSDNTTTSDHIQGWHNHANNELLDSPSDSKPNPTEHVSHAPITHQQQPALCPYDGTCDHRLSSPGDKTCGCGKIRRDSGHGRPPPPRKAHRDSFDDYKRSIYSGWLAGDSNDEVKRDEPWGFSSTHASPCASPALREG